MRKSRSALASSCHNHFLDIPTVFRPNVQSFHDIVDTVTQIGFLSVGHGGHKVELDALYAPGNNNMNRQMGVVQTPNADGTVVHRVVHTLTSDFFCLPAAHRNARRFLSMDGKSLIGFIHHLSKIAAHHLA